MKCKIPAIIATIMAMAFSANAQLSFTQQPTLTNVSGQWKVEFTVNQATDVEVAIVNMADSSIIRHLAAGVLGSAAPAPLTAGTFHQIINWDGKDDVGQTAATTNISVRVRAGMSVSMDKTAGGNPYAFQSSGSGYWSFQGLVLGKDGKLYVYGSAGPDQFVTVRQFSGTGNYERTVYPVPAGQQASQLSGFGVNNWLNGQYSPKTTRLSGPELSTTILSKQTASLVPIGNLGELVIANMDGLTMLKFNANSTISGSGVEVPIVSSPALPNHYYTGGPRFACLSADGKNYYFSGYYESGSGSGGDPVSVDTGFWRDGQVFKINVTTGVASPFISLTGVPTLAAARAQAIGPIYAGSGSNTCAAIHGTAIDDSGHIFVCDRWNGRISVYDTTGAYLAGIPVKAPDCIQINKVTNEIYVLNRMVDSYHAGYIRLFKFANWRSGARICSTLVCTAGMGQFALDKTYLAVSTAGAKPVVWVGYLATGVRAYQDEGTSLTKVRDFVAENADINLGYDRVAVDRNTENTYVQDSWEKIYRIEDWWKGTPTVVPCTSSAGQRLYGTDFCITRDNQFYLREGNSYSGPINRYTLDHRMAPINFPNTGKNMLTPYIYSRYGVGFGEHGFGVAPDKHVAVMYMYEFAKYYVGSFPDQGGSDTTVGTPIVKPIEGGYVGCGGVKFDSRNNMYIGLSIRAPQHQIPAPFASDWGYLKGVGAVVRYPVGATGSVNVGTNTATGSDKIYTAGFAPFSGTSGECQCRSPRFDIDLYDRLFIPNAVTQKVTVVDNNDNQILQFGEYGNWDSYGPQSPVPTTDVPMAWPVAAAASDNYIYISDMVNTRVTRVKMNFILNSLPGIEGSKVDAGAEDAVSSTSVESSPNPFNPESRILVRLARASNVRLEVYDATGRFVKAIATGMMKAGPHAFSWNATDRFDRPVSSGVYVYRLTAGGKVLTRKTMLAK